MRPILVITKLNTGGMERFCTTLCNTFARQDRTCTLCALHSAPLEGARQWLSSGVDYIELKRSARSAAPKLMQLCRERPDDPVLALGLEICAVLVTLKRLWLISNPVLYRESTAVLSHCTWFWKYVIHWFVSGTDGLIVQSHQALSDLERLFKVRQPVCLIRNPCAYFDGVNSRTCHVPRTGTPLRLLTVGRLDGMKGHARLLDALPRLRQHFPGARLTMVGTGTQASRLMAQSLALGLSEAVEWAGFTTDPRRWYEQADLFVLPSHYEGQPNVLIEALAMGCPVIAADCAGGTRELMEELGLGSFLVEGDFTERLPDAVERVLASDDKVWATARGRLETMACPAAVADQVWAFMEELMNHGTH